MIALVRKFRIVLLEVRIALQCIFPSSVIDVISLFCGSTFVEQVGQQFGISIFNNYWEFEFIIQYEPRSRETKGDEHFQCFPTCDVIGH